MVPDDCASVEFLLQADLDGELDISGAATLAAHLVDCPTCQAQQEAVSRLSARLRSELPYYAAPARLREAIQSSAEKLICPRWRGSRPLVEAERRGHLVGSGWWASGFGWHSRSAGRPPSWRLWP
jgi:anti-sigma factor RsiW